MVIYSNMSEKKEKNHEKTRGNHIIVSFLIVMVLAFGYYFYDKYYLSEPESESDVAESVQGMEETGKVVARVNGKEIKQSQVDKNLPSVLAAFKEQGADTTDPKVIEQATESVIEDLIRNEVLFQGAKEEKLKLTDEEMKPLLVQKYLNLNIDVSNLGVTQAEIEAFYKKAGETQGDLPPIDQVTDQIKQQLITQKQQEAVNKFVQSLRDKAEIVRE